MSRQSNKLRARKRRDFRHRVESLADHEGVFYYPWEFTTEIRIRIWAAQGRYTPPGEKALPPNGPALPPSPFAPDCELCGDTGEVAGDPLSADGMGPCPDCFPPDSMGD